MILVDTSVWVEHLRRGSVALAGELEAGQVLTHPFVIGELGPPAGIEVQGVSTRSVSR